MATNIKDTTIAATYKFLVKRDSGTYSQPGMNIEIQNDSGVAQATGLYLESNATSANVGIGIADPDSQLEVYLGGGTTNQLKLSYGATTFATFAVDTNHDLTITPSSTGQVIFKPTTDQTNFFQILDADGGTPIFNVDATNERVSIGVSTPDATLEVNGTAYAWKGTNSNTVFGRDAGNYATVDGTHNTYIGFECGHAVGHDANTEQNVGVGSQCMSALTTGGKNTAIGYSAGAGLTTTSFNTAIGRSAVSGAGAGQNTGLGYETLKGNTGTANIAIGMQCMEPVSSGSNNICIGKEAGNQINAGSDNVIIGKDVDVATSNHNNCIAIGNNFEVVNNDFAFGKASNVVSNNFDTDALWYRSSDERKKTNIEDDTLGLSFINDLQTKTFKWRPAEEHPVEWEGWNDLKDENGELTGEKEYHEMNTTSVMHGLIAQDVKVALDTAGVSTFGGWKEKANGEQSLSGEAFIYPLIKAVQELSAKVTALENA